MTWMPLLLLALPCLFWTQGPGQVSALREAGITRVCVPQDEVESWRGLDVAVTAIPPDELEARGRLRPPGIVPRAGLASPTRAPWIDTNGSRFLRARRRAFVVKVPAGKAVLAAAEAFAYDADVLLKIAPEDLAALGRLFAFVAQIQPLTLPDIADFAVVDDGSRDAGEIMNLFVRRNLLFKPVPSPTPEFPITVKLGTAEYPRELAEDPSEFALAIRRQLTDQRRSLRIFGSEVVIARLTGDGTRARVHLLNYGGREIAGLRVRVRGAYSRGEAFVAERPRAPLTEPVVADGFTEFTVPTLTTYAVVDLSK